MLNSTTITNNLNHKPENPFVARQEGVIVDAIHSQAFLFREGGMSKFIRKDSIAPLCACGCGEKVPRNSKGWNKFINGHNKSRLGHKNSKKTNALISNAQTGRRHTEEHKKKNSIAQKKRCSSLQVRKKMSERAEGKNNGMYGKQHSEETRKKISQALIGIKYPPRSKEHRKKIGLIHKGKSVSEESKRKNAIAHIGKRHSEVTLKKLSILNSGPNNANWKGGISTEPYCFIWSDKTYKEFIHERNSYKCQNPDCRQNCLHLHLHIHHINYIKKDCDLQNLISLCPSCNARANFNRGYWTKFYQEIMSKKYGYSYNE